MSNEASHDAQPADFTAELAASITGLGVVWAQTSTGVIGKDGGMPWNLPEDMKHFSRLTNGHPVIMGRKTWESFPDKYRPLPGRTNLVITRKEGWGGTPEAEGAFAVKSLDEALLESQFAPGHEMVWIIGGGEIFAQAIPRVDRMYLTIVHAQVEGDAYFPEFEEGEWICAAETFHTSDERHAYSFTFRTLDRR